MTTPLRSSPVLIIGVGAPVGMARIGRRAHSARGSIECRPMLPEGAAPAAYWLVQLELRSSTLPSAEHDVHGDAPVLIRASGARAGDRPRGDVLRGRHESRSRTPSPGGTGPPRCPTHVTTGGGPASPTYDQGRETFCPLENRISARPAGARTRGSVAARPPRRCRRRRGPRRPAELFVARRDGTFCSRPPAGLTPGCNRRQPASEDDDRGDGAAHRQPGSAMTSRGNCVKRSTSRRSTSMWTRSSIRTPVSPSR